MYWSLHLVIKKQDEAIKCLTKLQLDDERNMHAIANDMKLVFHSNILSRDRLDHDSKFVRLEACRVREGSDPRNIAVGIVDETFFHVYCEKELCEYLEAHRSNYLD